MVYGGAMNREVLVNKLRSIRGQLSDEGVEHVAIFGSRARGDDRRDSDIDLLIEVAQEQDFSILNLVGVEQIVADELGIPANAFMRRSLEPNFRATIQADIIEVF